MGGTKDALKFLKKDAGGMAIGGALILTNSELSKTEKLWEMIKLKVLPISATLAASILGISTAIKSVIKNSGVLEESFRRLDKIKLATTQFETLYRNLERAKQQVAAIIQLTSGGVFNFDDVKEGTRALAILSNRVLDTTDNMRLMADVAAALGTSYTDLTMAVGQAHRQMASGDIEGGLERLKSMGVLSREAEVALKNLALAGGSLGQAWSIVQGELEKSRGKMEEVGKTTEGLSKKLEQARSAMAVGFGKAFLEPERETIKTTTELFEKLTPVLTDVGNALAAVTGTADKWWEKLKVAVVSMQAFAPLVGIMTRALIILGGAIGLVGLGSFLINLKATYGAVMMVLKSIGSLTASTNLFTAALAMNAAGSKIAGGATMLLAVANNTLGVAIATATKWLKGMWTALISNPLFMVSTAVLFLVAAWVQQTDAANDARNAMIDLAASHKKVQKAIDDQIASMATLDDLHATELAATEQLILAEEELAKTRAEKDKMIREEKTGLPSIIKPKAFRDLEEKEKAQEQQRKDLEGKLGTIAERKEKMQGAEVQRERGRIRAEEAFALKEAEFQNQLQGAPEPQKLAMIGVRKATLQSRQEERSLLLDEEARVKMVDKATEGEMKRDQTREAAKKKRLEARLQSPSEVVRMLGQAQVAVEAGEGEEAGRLSDLAATKRKELEQASPLAVQELATEEKLLALSIERSKIDVETSQELAAIWSEGLAAAQLEADARIKGLEAQIALEEKRGALADATAISVMQAQKQIAEREKQFQTEAATRALESINSQISVATDRAEAVAAAMGGDFGEAGRLTEKARTDEQDQIRRERLQDLKATVADEGERYDIVEREAAQRERAFQVEKEVFKKQAGIETGILELEGVRGEGKRAAQQQATVLKDVEGHKATLAEGIARGLTGDELTDFATKRTMALIAAKGTEPTAIASSLAAIGGGGEVGVSNPLLTVAQEQKRVLDIIAKNTSPPESTPESTVLFQ